MYLGASLSTSCFEIGQEDLNGIDKINLALSFWGFNPAFRRYPGVELNARERINIYDISNLAYDMLNDVIMDVVLERDGAERENIINNYSFLNRENIRVAIRKFALCQACTFVTDKFRTPPSIAHPNGKLVNNFYEEYVLPQLLTEAIRLHKYDGIIYPSTKYNSKEIKSSTGWISGAFKTNLTMFSHYYSHQFYDVPLIKNFIIDAQKKFAISTSEIKAKVEGALNSIEFHDVFIASYSNNGYFAQRVTAITKYCKKRLRLYQVLLIDGQNYSETYAGNIEIQFVIDYTDFILTELRGAYIDEFGKFDEDAAAGKYTFSWTKTTDDNPGILF